MTGAVDRTITERLSRLRKRRNKADFVERILRIGRECAALPVVDRRKPEEMLCDLNGLPKRSSAARGMPRRLRKRMAV